MQDGFKQTEVGVIPEDWEVVAIRQVCKLINGRGFKPHEWKKEGLPIIRIQNLNGSSDFNYYQGLYDNKIEVEKGQLLFAWSGSRGTSFGPHIWTGSLGLLNYHTWKMVVNQDEVFHNFFLYALRELTKIIEENAHGASALVHTQKWEMEGFKFPLPPTRAEQEAIAGALGDADGWIGALDRLIAKKRLIKQGAMQTLLTGQKRLPPFNTPQTPRHQTEVGLIPEDWDVVALPEVIWYQEGPGLRNWQFTKKGLKVINITNLQETGKLDLSKTDRHISWEELDKLYRHFLIDEGDFVMASSGNSYCKTSLVRPCDLPLLMNTSVIRFKPLDTMSQIFMRVLLGSAFFKTQIDLLITGGAQPNFGPAHLRKIKIPLPPTKAEQTAIATVLSDMDSEIAALEAKLAKAKALKQGMMQQLLSGQTRLV